MFEQYLDVYFSKFKASLWRKKILHTEEIDLSLKHGLKFLKDIYTRFSGRYANPGAPKYMSLSEFSDIF